MWQRARMLTCRTVGSAPVGFECWVVMGPPARPDPNVLAVHPGIARPWVPRALRYRSNILSDPRLTDGDPTVSKDVWIRATAVELLARGPEDFCDDPPRIRWGAWKDQAPD